MNQSYGASVIYLHKLAIKEIMENNPDDFQSKIEITSNNGLNMQVFQKVTHLFGL